MRFPRLKPVGRDAFYHVYNRVTGYAEDRPFGEVEKEHFIRLMSRLSRLYVVEVLAFTVMGNHFHAILFAPAEAPSEALTSARYAAYYRGKRELYPGTAACRRMAGRLNDISWFLHDLEHQFSSWFNRTRPQRRRGALWAGRFKHTLLEEGVAVWDCWKYIEMNPVRAGLVADPADYRFSSFGVWNGRGRHPFQTQVEARLMPQFRDLLHVESQKDLYGELRREFARLKTLRRGPEAMEQAIAAVAEPPAFSTVVTRRMRYWTDGLVIGSKRFVVEIMTAARGAEHMARHRCAVAAEETIEGLRLVCYRRLRVDGT
jgi:putative transposase